MTGLRYILTTLNGKSNDEERAKTMELSEEQRAAVAGWVETGAGLSDIQQRLQEQFDLKMTYMDVRFLVLDLGLEIQDRKTAPAPPADPAVDGAGPAQPPAAGPDAIEPPATPAPGGGVSVSVDRVVKPGAVVSGTVAFSDGTQATWMLDQLGRLALDAGDPGYRPSEQDLREFQTALQNTLQSQGF